MSDAASVPFTETKAPESPERLHRGALSLIDISASTMANIGPAYSFFFGFGFLVFTAGVAAPLTIIVAGIAIALLGNTLSQFSRAQPSTGGFISFVGKTFGGTSAVTTALLCGAGYIIAISSVLAISGGFLADILQYYFGWNVPWIILSVLLTAGATVMTIRGVGVSTKLAGFFFAFEMLVLIVVSVAILIKNGGHLSIVPFEPSHITKGFTGLAAGFPLAIYLFIGWENSAALAEETGNPRRNVPRAVYLSIAMMIVGYVLFAFATVTGFHYNGTALASSSIPFISVAHDALAGFAFFAYVAGLTSTIGVLISAVNSQARLIFNAGREGLLPRWIGRVHPVRKTPMNAIYVFVAIASAIILVWALLHLLGGHKQSGSMVAINFFVESSTLGTILILVVYFLANLALPFYYRRFRPAEFNVVKHAVLPVLGMIAIAVPVYYLCKPGQAAPYDWFPYAALAMVVVAVVYAWVLNRRDPGLGERAGSIVADE
ncbi:MAG TPA: APC family permease [Streptosporangiaceae bacterium]|jgi:amino acid transporter|nr:APC family permease [Streptosporangiaceae bacterium]